MHTQLVAQVNKQYLNEFLALMEAGATEAEALLQVAYSNEISVQDVIAAVHSEQAKMPA